MGGATKGSASPVKTIIGSSTVACLELGFGAPSPTALTVGVIVVVPIDIIGDGMLAVDMVLAIGDGPIGTDIIGALVNEDGTTLAANCIGAVAICGVSVVVVAAKGTSIGVYAGCIDTPPVLIGFPFLVATMLQYHLIAGVIWT